ncbi:hypothetical protein RRG08_029339 [Elysia crispata]|uniref:Uncharacterized protein n=1 Tax=Elysia crispata TaxID=231223 RepID=A0AAE1AU08_9GAST|nr:hypothetical protein RRG08_029339 [Elysia crispata]
MCVGDQTPFSSVVLDPTRACRSASLTILIDTDNRVHYTPRHAGRWTDNSCFVPLPWTRQGHHGGVAQGSQFPGRMGGLTERGPGTSDYLTSTLLRHCHVGCRCFSQRPWLLVVALCHFSHGSRANYSLQGSGPGRIIGRCGSGQSPGLVNRS